jgi:hypothetical protein
MFNAQVIKRCEERQKKKYQKKKNKTKQKTEKGRSNVTE